MRIGKKHFMYTVLFKHNIFMTDSFNPSLQLRRLRFRKFIQLAQIDIADKLQGFNLNRQVSVTPKFILHHS